jgi:hypothetical protein
MSIGRRFLLIAIPLAFLVPMAIQAQNKKSWDGVWEGMLDNAAPIAVTIANDKVVSYTIKGSPHPIEYNKITAASASFGDRDHYFMKLTKTSDTTASATVHGRLGFASASLTRQ